MILFGNQRVRRFFESADWPTDWTVYNAGGGGSGSITLSDALARSVDSVFAAVAIDVGADAVIDAAGRLGVSIADTSAAVPPEAVGIGAGNVSAMDVAAMFTTLSRDGYQTQPTLIDSIADADGQILYQAAPGEIRTVAPEVIELLRDPLAEVQMTGTAPRARLGVDQIGKTGSTADFSVAWYAGSTDEYTAVVVASQVDGGPLTNVEFRGRLYARVYGGSVPAPIWKDIMEQIITP